VNVANDPQARDVQRESEDERGRPDVRPVTVGTERGLLGNAGVASGDDRRRGRDRDPDSDNRRDLAAPGQGNSTVAGSLMKKTSPASGSSSQFPATPIR